VHCQVETLRFCFPQSIRRILNDLPETLDATYERTLLGISKQTREYASRLFQCLIISIRPLHVKELAELFVIQPYGDVAPAGWRPEDPEEFIISTCSTLVSIVDIDGEKVVQFSHFSVREYLTSGRIGNSEHLSPFHIRPKSAHTLLARACLSTLFQLGCSTDESRVQSLPLASYAAEHWVDHARFEDVSSDIRSEMDHLFDKDNPYLAAWIWLYDIENSRRRDQICPPLAQPDATPLYYAALCGFRDVTEGLLNAHPRDLNARGGQHETPLHAAVHKGHLDVVLLLLDRGASVESRGPLRQTALYMASSRGYVKISQSLIDHGADPNAECDDKEDCRNVKWTALQVASKNGRLDTARVLLERGADVNYKDTCGRRPLQFASRQRSNALVCLLLDRGANPNASDTWGMNALHEASIYGQMSSVTTLLEYGANVHAQSKSGSTPLHFAASEGHLEVAQILLDHGADPNTRGRDHWTALHEAAAEGRLHVVEVLLRDGADPRARTRWGETPSELAPRQSRTQTERLLSELGEQMQRNKGLGLWDLLNPAGCELRRQLKLYF
jgi:ankyrin repeat protein